MSPSEPWSADGIRGGISADNPFGVHEYDNVRRNYLIANCTPTFIDSFLIGGINYLKELKHWFFVEKELTEIVHDLNELLKLNDSDRDYEDTWEWFETD